MGRLGTAVTSSSTTDRGSPRETLITKPIRVGIVAPSLAIVGGQSIQAQRLFDRLATLPDIDPVFIPVNPRLPGPLALLQRVKYLRTIVTSMAYWALLVWRLPRVDVVHAFSASYWSYVLAPLPAMVLGRALGRVVILNYRSGEAPDHLERWRWLTSRTLGLAHRIVVPSGYLVEVFRQHGFAAEPIANVVDLDRIPFRERLELEPRFLANRNFEAHYNVACVLRAFQLIQARIPTATLTVVGDGPEREALERLAAELRLQQTTFEGLVPPDEMGRYYHAADVYLNAPLIDNMPGSILEAFAAGLPVVTSDAGGIPYIVRDGENGRLVPQNDPEAMATAAIDLLERPEVAVQMTGRARKEVAERYTWTSVLDSWRRCYGSLGEVA